MSDPKLKRPFRLIHFWPVLIPIVATIWVVAVERAGRPELHSKPVQEVIAIVVTALAVIAYGVHYRRSRARICLVLGALACAVFLREIHWEWTTKFIYIAVAAVGAWAFYWRDSLHRYLANRPKTRVWIVLTGCCYVLSQFIARRGFQHMFGEDIAFSAFMDDIYGDLEEFMENSAHILLLLTAVSAWTSGGDAHSTRADEKPC